MRLFLGLILLSFSITSGLIVPFINFLYQKKFLRKKQKTHDFLDKRTPIFDKYNQDKAGTPVGGGILLVIIITVLFLLVLLALSYYQVFISVCFSLTKEVSLILFTLISFGALGFFDDLKKIFKIERQGVFGLRLKYKFLLQWFLAFVVASLLYFDLGISIVNVPKLGVFDIGLFYIPLAAFIIVAFTNAFNITDGLDGLSCGLLLIALFAFSIISFQILDIPMMVFSAIWIGVLIAFLYFNVYPARIFLGDTGALAFGATMALIGLMLGKIIALTVIGGIFIIEVTSSLLQMLTKAIWKKKLFRAAPFHLWLRDRGWEEPKIVFRAWLVGIILAIFGLWLATF
ncbi:MAG: Phospho-N-acetylmuramoyl-pentapeptide-transferase [Microgenomates bacterium 39_6]|nr:MAG: Phospho-N-acetylmuramoyl-pentapeptide-transferase [Microgenomates bacterium 39_6]